MLNEFFPKIVPFVRLFGKKKYSTFGQDTDDNIIRRMGFSCWLNKATTTIFSSLCSGLATMGTPSHPNLTLYAHYINPHSLCIKSLLLLSELYQHQNISIHFGKNSKCVFMFMVPCILIYIINCPRCNTKQSIILKVRST